MPYLNETGLSYYDPKLKEWIASQPVKTIPSSLYPWTLTDKAGTVTCWPVGGTELKPTVDYIFTETPPANGQPKAPDNPSTITGVSSVKVTRCGKNILAFPFHGSSATTNGITFTVNSDGAVSAKGTASNTASFYVTYNYTLHLDASQTYIMSGVPAGGSNSTYYMQMQGTNSTETGSGQIISGVSNPEWVRIRIASGYAIQGSIVFKPQLELGSTATSFEKYEGTDYTISLGSTYYGGTLDVASGVMTVTHAAVTPDASTVDISSAPAALPLDYADTYGRTITSADGTSLVVGSTGGTVVYKLATPQTVQISPTQILALSQPDKYTPRLNTTYTDAQAVQVGYVKSPIREEFELTQAIVAQGGNI